MVFSRMVLGMVVASAKIVSFCLFPVFSSIDCRNEGGTIHKEIFEFVRFEKGPYKGKEWEEVVKRVIDDWGEFVKNYV